MLAFVLAGAGIVMTGVAKEIPLRLLGKTGAGAASLAEATLGSYVWTDANCGNCHTRDSMFSHPVDVPASPHAPESLVLHQGRIACTTCHDDGDYAAHDRAVQTGDPMLRMPAEQLCISCHTGGTDTDGHALAQHEAHTRTHDNRISASRETGETGEASEAGDSRSDLAFTHNLDARSRQCLVCHDGMVAADADARPRLSGEMFSKNHPVGMAYPAHARAADELSLHTEENRDPRVRLFDGIVGCESCHNVYSENRSMLVIDNLGSRLCMACHNL